MAMPGTGAISLLQAQIEYGGGSPIGLNEYYRGGSYVPVITSTLGIPASGTISLSNFYGTSTGGGGPPAP